MTAALRHRILIVIAAYGTVLTAWFGFARWLAPAIITSPNPGYSARDLESSDRGDESRLALCDDRAQPLAALLRCRADRRIAAPGIVMLICLHGPHQAPNRKSQPRRVKPWASAVLILLSFAYLAWALYRGGIQDYYFFIQMWREVQFGHDPWFYAYGAFGKYPMNAYGPLFNIFALPAWLNPLFPKLLFAAAYLAFANWLILDSCMATRVQACHGHCCSLVLDALLLGRDRQVWPF